jgi:hypothetical protein
VDVQYVGVSLLLKALTDLSLAVVSYPAKHAPLYPIGYKAPIGFSLAWITLTLVFRWLSIRDHRRNKIVHSEDESVSGEEYGGWAG